MSSDSSGSDTNSDSDSDTDNAPLSTLVQKECATGSQSFIKWQIPQMHLNSNSSFAVFMQFKYTCDIEGNNFFREKY